MRAVYWTGIIIIAAVVALFAASNRATVSLGMWPLPFLAEAPLYLVVVVSLLFGMTIGGLAVWIKGSVRRREWRACRRQNAALARELAATQAQLAGELQSAQNAGLPRR